MRMIDADALLNRLIGCVHPNTSNAHMMAFLQTLINEIYAQPTIEPTKANCWGCKCSKMEQTQWIPVSERLPKQGQWVIAWAKSNTDNDWEVPSIVQYMGDGKFRWNTILPISDEVIAWMPLPEPYKKGEHND